MGEVRLTVVSRRHVPVAALVQQAIRGVQAASCLRRIESLFPGIRYAIRGVADALMEEMPVDEARSVLEEALLALKASWDNDAQAWRDGQLNVRELCCRVLEVLYEPAIRRLGGQGAKELRFPSPPSLEGLMGQNVWRAMHEAPEAGSQAIGGAWWPPGSSEP